MKQHTCEICETASRITTRNRVLMVAPSSTTLWVEMNLCEGCVMDGFEDEIILRAEIIR